jgi:hypothetical protein
MRVQSPRSKFFFVVFFVRVVQEVAPPQPGDTPRKMMISEGAKRFSSNHQIEEMDSRPLEFLRTLEIRNGTKAIY